MRILHLTTEFPPIIYGGLGIAVGGLVKASAGAGIDVGVLLFGGSEDAGTYAGPRAEAAGDADRTALRQGDISVIKLSTFDDLDKVERIARAIAPDIIHLHSFWLWSQAQGLRERLGVPLVYTVHSLDKAEYEVGYGPPECVTQWVQQESVVYAADRIIALTGSERRLVTDYCPGIENRIRIIGNGVDAIPTRRKSRRAASEAVVLFSGRFVERKGLWDLLDAIPLVHAQFPDVRYVLAGGHRNCSGADMEGWLMSPALREVGSRITFTGWLTSEQMARQYDEADILVVPSWYEPFGLVVLEGMLHGLAVAASAVGGPAEIIEHGRTGHLFPPRSPGALAASVLELVGNVSERKRMAAAAGRAVREKWLWPRIVMQMTSVYAELLPKDRGKAWWCTALSASTVQEGRQLPGTPRSLPVARDLAHLIASASRAP
jgi:glycogen(starch) synthase